MDSPEAQKVYSTLSDRLPRAAADDDYLQNVFNEAYAIAAILAVVVLVYGGIQYITSQGNSNKTSRAKNTIMYAIIGLVVIVLAALITAFVTNITMEARS